MVTGHGKNTDKLSIGLYCFHISNGFSEYQVINSENSIRRFNIFVLHSYKEEAVIPLMINTLNCWYTCQLMQSLWKTLWKFPQKLKISLLNDIAIVFLHTNPKAVSLTSEVLAHMYTYLLHT